LPRAEISFSVLFGNTCSILFGNTTKTAPVFALHNFKAILNFTIRVSFLLPPLFSLPPSPSSFLFFLRKQPRCRCYTDVKAILDITISWVVWCRSKKGAEEFISGKEMFLDCDETESKEAMGKKREQKECISRAERTI